MALTYFNINLISTLLWLSTEEVAFFTPRPHPYLPCFAPLSRLIIERLSLHWPYWGSWNWNAVTRPQDKTIAILSFWLPRTVAWPKSLLEKLPLGRALQWDALASSPILQTLIINYYTHTHMHSLPPPPRSLASVALKPPVWQAGLCQRRNSGCGTGWLLAGAGFPPLWQSRVSMVYVLLCWGVFPVPTLYSPRSIVWGLFFFSSLSSCYAVFFLPLSTYLHFTTHCSLYDCVCDQ